MVLTQNKLLQEALKRQINLCSHLHFTFIAKQIIPAFSVGSMPTSNVCFYVICTNYTEAQLTAETLNYKPTEIFEQFHYVI